MYAADIARTDPDRVAVVMAASGDHLTFQQYEQRCNRVAHLFRSAGLRRGDHIAICMENNLACLEVQGGAERSGLYYTVVNSHLTGPEAAYIVDNCDAKIFVASTGLGDAAFDIARRCPRVGRFLLVGSEQAADPFEPYEPSLAHHPPTPIVDEQLGAAMLYSSGTTGRPKGILRPVPAVTPGQPLPALSFVSALKRFRPGMVYLSPAPLYHAAPQAGIGAALRMGATVVVMERFEAESFLDSVDRHGVTHTQVVPTMLSRLLSLPDAVRSKYDLSSLEVIVHSAAPCPETVKEAMIDWVGPILYEYYGATEASGFTFCDSGEWLAHRGTVGRPVIGELEILDDEGSPCPEGTVGTVWFRGATNFEYYKDPEGTRSSQDATGTASTVGDVGRVDADGYLYLTGRKAHMIISGGVNIYPQEIENLLSSHPSVADVAVIGVPNHDFGEEVKAVVQPVDPGSAHADLADQLMAFCRDRLAHFKCPRSVDFVDSLPRLPTGKLYKQQLHDRYWTTEPTPKPGPGH